MKTKGKNKEPPEARENAATGLSFESDQCLIGLERSTSFWTGKKAKQKNRSNPGLFLILKWKLIRAGISNNKVKYTFV